MTLILASRPNVYSSSPLDRIAQRREDAAWIAEKLADPNSLFVPVWRTRNLVRGHTAGEPEAVYISGEMAATLRMAHAQDGSQDRSPWAFLGILESRAVFAIDISAADDPVPLLPEELGTFVDLRSVGWGVPRPEASVLAHARGLLHWRQRHKFCGVCGGACECQSAGHVMQCTVCNAQHFPHTDP